MSSPNEELHNWFVLYRPGIHRGFDLAQIVDQMFQNCFHIAETQMYAKTLQELIVRLLICLAYANNLIEDVVMCDQA